MRVLIVSPIQVSPARSGGQARTLMLARGLAAAGHEVRLDSMIGRKSDLLRLAGSGETPLGQGVRESVSRGLLLGGIGILAFKVGLPPLWANARLRWLPLSRRLAADLEWAEAVVADFPYTAAIWRHAGSRLRILNTHNVEHRLFTGRVAARVLRTETDAARDADLILCCGPADREWLSTAGAGRPVFLIPNAVDRARFAAAAGRRAEFRASHGIDAQARVLLFAASAYGPNTEGREFLEAFVDRHGGWMERAGIVILVAGSVARPGRRPGLVMTGPLPEIEPAFAAADFALNPIFRGSGTSVKLAEYLAAGLPVIGTGVGARGFAFEDRVHGRVFGDADGLEAVLRALPAAATEWRGMVERAETDNRAMIDPDAALAPLLAELLARRVARSGSAPGSESRGSAP